MIRPEQEGTNGDGSLYPSLVASWVTETIPELEAALLTGKVNELLDRPDVQEVIGEDLALRYRELADDKIKHDGVFRQQWIPRFLDVFRRWLQEPQKLFTATVAIGHSQSKSWSLHDPTPPSIYVSHRDGEVTIRPDQALSARRWGVWFSFEDDLLERAYTNFLVQNARQYLTSNIKSLWNLEATYLAGQSKLSTKPAWNSEPRGERFEHLMLDVLNELRRAARPAPLAEDILERTDLRVTFPTVKRPLGSRVQVSLTKYPEEHARKVNALRLPEEFILLTPLELARCAVHPPTHAVFADFPWADFWASLGGAWRDVHGLAQELHALFCEAFSRPLHHPLGPMWLLSAPMRLFIRRYAEHRAITTTNAVRARLQRSRQRFDSVNKYTGPYWKAKFSESCAQNGSDNGEASGSLPTAAAKQSKPMNQEGGCPVSE